MRTAALCAVLAACCLSTGAWAQATAPTTGEQALSGFIRVSGTNFVDDDCNEFVFSGYNTWQATEQASGLIGGLPALEAQLDNAVNYNLTVIRAFAFVVQDGYNQQLAPGVYNESLLVAMDEVVAQAATRGLKLILILADNWQYNANMSDCKPWYAAEAGQADPDTFWIDPVQIAAYKENAQTILNRVNTVNGRVYGSDPTIFAWDLINEGRCETANCTAQDIQNWIADVAPFVRGLTKSLVTVGEDGFFQATNCQADYVNPVPNDQEWPLQTGQDFLPNHYLPSIDFASIHMWPDNWGRTDTPFVQGWLEAHEQDSLLIGKPLILEEFGKSSGPFSTSGTFYGNGSSVELQEQVYKLVYSYVESSIDNDGAIKGVAFWRWNAISTGDLSAQDAALSLNTSSPAFSSVVAPFSQRIVELSLAKNKVTGCTNVNTAASVGAPVASSSSVTTAGRKLKAYDYDFNFTPIANAPGPSEAQIDSMVTNCTAFYPYSLQAQSGTPGPSRK